VHLVLLDIDMPIMDGIAVCKAIRADAALRHLPVVMMTGRSTREIASRGLAAGALEVLTKPFDLDVLQATLAKHALAPSAASDAPAPSETS
jgi:CheY-like chemotaxis protein